MTALQICALIVLILLFAPSLPRKIFLFLNGWLGRFNQWPSIKLAHFVFSFISNTFEARLPLPCSVKKITQCWRYISCEILQPIVNFKPQFKADPHPLSIQFSFLGFGQTGQLIGENRTAHFVRRFVVSMRIVIRLTIHKYLNLLAQAKQLFRPSHLQKSLFPFLKSQIMTLLVPRNSDSNCYSHDRAQTLHPSRCVGRKPPMFYPVSNRPYQKPKCGSPKEQNPQCPQGQSDHLLRNSTIHHASGLPPRKRSRACPFTDFPSIQEAA
ncbi:hypothetical protein ABIE16_002050 [Pseudomonas sp. 2725]